MSAPINQYLTIDATFRGSNNISMVVNPARAVVDLATIKSRFYLDDVIGFKANYLGTEYHGFWGTCIVGGINESMHRTNRVLEIHGNTFGGNKRTFNDAGLNTLGFTVMNLIKTFASNNIRMNTTYKSAWWVDSDDIGFAWKKQGAANYDYFSVGSAPLKQVTDTSDKTLVTNLVKDDTIVLQPYITNGEGTYLGTISTFIVKGPVFPFGANKRDDLCSSTSTLYSFYMLDDDFNRLDTAITQNASATGIYGYLDPDMTTPMAAGYYAGVSGDNTKVFIVGSDGQWIQYGICSIAPPLNTVGIQMVAVFENGAYYFHMRVTRQDLSFGGDITIGGDIGGFDSNNNQLAGAGNGSGNWQATVVSGSNIVEVPTSYNPTNPPGISYYAPLITYNPQGVTYDIYRTGAGE